MLDAPPHTRLIILEPGAEMSRDMDLKVASLAALDEVEHPGWWMGWWWDWFRLELPRDGVRVAQKGSAILTPVRTTPVGDLEAMERMKCASIKLPAGCSKVGMSWFFEPGEGSLGRSSRDDRTRKTRSGRSTPAFCQCP